VTVTPAPARHVVRLGDRIFSGTARAAAMLIMVALAGVAVFLVIEGRPGLTAPADVYRPADDFWSYVGPLVWGTVLAAVVALLIAVPFSIGVALFISHYAPPRIAAPIAYVIDLLAAIPSVVYGLWGGLALASSMTPVIDWLYDNLDFIPFFAGPPSVTGRTMLTAGIVLAIMVIPITTAICREVFAQTPRLHEEAAMALGATRWETIRLAVLPYARSGVVSGVMLGLGRALGETMAVAMVLSATPVVTLNLVSNSNPATIASNIAANYKEATPDRQALLIATGLVLFVVTFAVNFVARLVVARSERTVTR
jgi:phosphate transport system permease protein